MIKKILEEEIQTMLNCNHDFGFPDSPGGDYEGITKKNLFCKKCKEHFLAIIKTYRENLFNPDKYHLGPKCQICGKQDTVDKFDSSTWLQIPTEEPYNRHGDNLIWVCPNCIAKKYNIRGA